MPMPRRRKSQTQMVREFIEESDSDCSMRVQQMLDDEDDRRLSGSRPKQNNTQGRGYGDASRINDPWERS